MQYTDAYEDASDLTVEARAAADAYVAQFLLNTYLPPVENPGLTFSFSKDDAALADAASFRSWTTSADYGRTEGGRSTTGKLPPISRAFRIDEYDQIMLQGGSGVNAQQQRYARRIGVSIAARVVLAQAEAIENGTLTLDENGLALEIDYGRHADLTATAAKLFTAADATPIDDLESIIEAYVGVNGQRPGVSLLHSRVLSALSRNPEIIALALPGTTGVSRVSTEDVLSVLRDYNVPAPRVYEEVIDKKPVFSSNKIIFLPSSGSVVLEDGPLGSTQWGVPAEAINATYGIGAADRSGVFAAAFQAPNPERMEILGSAVVIPAVSNPDAVATLEVLGA